jgi:hypothetical protein
MKEIDGQSDRICLFPFWEQLRASWISGMMVKGKHYYVMVKKIYGS